MSRELAILLKLQVYLSQLLEQQQPTTFAAHYARRLEKRIARYRERLRVAACSRDKDAFTSELVIAQYWKQLPYCAQQRAALDRMYRRIGRRVNSLKRRTRERLKTLFSKNEELGKTLDMRGIDTAIRGPFREYFLTKRLVEYMRDFLRRSLMRRAAREEIVRTEIRGIGDLQGRVHCLHCNKAISRSVLSYHLKGKEHTRRTETGSAFNETSSEVSGMSVEGGIVSVEEDDLLCVAQELKTLVRSLCGVRHRGLDGLCANLLIDPRCLLNASSTDTMPRDVHSRRMASVHAKKEPSFYCEVCSSAITGTSRFYAHFLEERHVRSLKALGTADVQRCFGVTKIALVTKLIQNVEEEEDAEGNVYEKRTYDDLSRHGLI